MNLFIHPKFIKCLLHGRHWVRADMRWIGHRLCLQESQNPARDREQQADAVWPRLGVSTGQESPGAEGAVVMRAALCREELNRLHSKAHTFSSLSWFSLTYSWVLWLATWRPQFPVKWFRFSHSRKHAFAPKVSYLLSLHPSLPHRES